MKKPLKRFNKSRKGCFCCNGICKCTVVFKLTICNLQMFSRSSDIKYFFTCSNLFCLISNYSNRRGVFRIQSKSMMGLFAKIVNGFQPLTVFAKSSILDVRLGFKYVSE